MNLKELRALFRQFWPSVPGKRSVYAGYLALKAHPQTLADIAMRNYVFADPPKGLSDRDGAILEGRRQCALEIVRLSRLDPATLWDVIEGKTAAEKLTDLKQGSRS